MNVPAIVSDVPRSLLYAATPFTLIALILCAIRVYTTLNYHWISHLLNASAKPGKKIHAPPQIPYTLPFLGNTLQFLNKQPGKYWQNLFSWHPRSSGVCTLLIGGKKTHIVYCQPAVQAMFKERTLKMDQFQRDLFQKVFMMPEDQIRNAEEGKHMEHAMNAQYLTKHERVNELTVEFMTVLDEVLGQDADEVVGKDSVPLYGWLRDRMFTASTTALMGETLLKMYPDYCKDFFDFDREFLSYFFDLPKFMMREPIARRDRILATLERWSRAMHEESGGEPIDPEGPAWEPLFGSRLNRARQIDYKNRKLNWRSSAALDLGMTFGLSSNAIPATNWMLMNVLNPRGDRTLLPRVMAELRQAEKEDGSVDVPKLISSPLLQSIWTETLRLYADILVTRCATQDITLPLDEDGKTLVKIKEGENIFAPCWLGHHDERTWSADEAPINAFFAERFLVPDPSNPGQQMFTMSGTNGKFFPFGGGRTICPGRVFAKQEALGAFAMVLLRFEFEVLGFMDKDGGKSEEFPGFASAFPGSGALTPGGDLEVKVTKRERLN